MRNPEIGWINLMGKQWGQKKRGETERSKNREDRTVVSESVGVRISGVRNREGTRLIASPLFLFYPTVSVSGVTSFFLGSNLCLLAKIIMIIPPTTKGTLNH